MGIGIGLMRETTLGLIPLGYNEGIPRSARNMVPGAYPRPAADDQRHGLHEPVRGRRLDLPIEAGDEVMLFGPGDSGEPTAQEWADLLDTLSYDIVTRFTGKIPRSYCGVTGDTLPVARAQAGACSRGHWRAGGLMVSWRRLAGVAGLAAGAVAAGAGAVVMAEKIAVGRIRLRPDPAADERFGDPYGEELTVRADDGLPLHVQCQRADRRAGHDHFLPRLRAQR